MEYKFTEIEPRWRKYWDEQEVYKVEIDHEKPKYYVLDMFPYPSGAGLHVGHPLGYIASDIFARYKRMKGFNVLHPMGFDAFGLPAEQYAIETGQHPRVTTEKNIEVYRKQLESLGFSYDWSREVKTCEPKYYKWTQWGFLQMFNAWYDHDAQKARPIDELIEHFNQNGTVALNAAHDSQLTFSSSEWQAFSSTKQHQILLDYRLAYQTHAYVNWCPALGTVLANDEVINGVSERGGHPVEKKKMRQWFLRITAYAERLLEGFETIDWPNSMREMQRNWIGRSEGAQVYFDVVGTEKRLEIFTTRPDTMFGATFMVLAPEHDWVVELTSKDQSEAVEAYRKYAAAKSDVDRQSEKKITGAFTGYYCINPVTGKQIPIWISEYVLIGYGTGAIMAVPSDDDRDHAFATHFDLPIIEVIDKSEYPDAGRQDKLGRMINSGFITDMQVPDAIEAMLKYIEEKKLGCRKVNYRLRDAGFSRQRYWGEPFPIIYRDNVPYALSESDLPVILPEIDNFNPSADGEAPLARNREWVELADDSTRETDTMPGYAGSSWYFLRYMDPHNEEAFVGTEAENYWQNVDFYTGGAEHAVGHLMYSRFWHKVLHDLGHLQTDEPFKKLINQGMIQGRSSIAYRITETNKYVSAELKDSYETTPIHVDVNLVSNDVLDLEAVRAWRKEFQDAEFIMSNGQFRCDYEVEKMSKRWYNVVNPDDLVAKYGADCLRMYEMFLGPVEQSKPWDTKGIDGVSRFLRKLWRLFFDNEGNLLVADGTETDASNKTLHKTIKAVTTDLERYSLNTCVSHFMIAVNELTDLKCKDKAILSDIVRLLAPFAPYVSEELWNQLGKKGSVHHADFPVWDESKLTESSFEYPVSVNGKVRAKVKLGLDISQDAAQAAVLEEPNIQKWTADKQIRKFIFVKGRIINVVVG